jgi:hypothetical protein
MNHSLELISIEVTLGTHCTYNTYYIEIYYINYFHGIKYEHVFPCEDNVGFQVKFHR